jgi:NCS1 family nucleobase:cation symporter-1
VSRPTAALVSGILGAIITFYSLFLSDIAKTMDLWMLTLLAWMTPWLAIVLVDFYLIRRGQVDVQGLYESPERSPYGDVVWPAIVSWAAGFVLSYVWANTPIYTSELAKRTGGADFSWLIALVVGGGLYLILRRRQAPAVAPAV